MNLVNLNQNFEAEVDLYECGDCIIICYYLEVSKGQVRVCIHTENNGGRA